MDGPMLFEPGDDFAVNTVDDGTAPSDSMTGDASNINRRNDSSIMNGSPTRGLVMLWVIALIAYWALGFFFRRVRG